MKSLARLEALQWRRDGITYRAILERLTISKSTLWRWLKEEGLVDGQSQQYTERRRLAQRKAVEAIRRKRIEKTQQILSTARREISHVTRQELRLLGAALYWAEGAKQKEFKTQVSERVVFANTDPRMLRLFVRFLKECCGVRAADLGFRIYLHETADAIQARTYWFKALGIALIKTAPITWKRHKPTVHRTNVGAQYHGLLRVVVRKSTDLNRRIMGWVEGICALGSGVTGNTEAFGASVPGSSPGSPAALNRVGFRTLQASETWS